MDKNGKRYDTVGQSNKRRQFVNKVKLEITFYALNSLISV